MGRIMLSQIMGGAHVCFPIQANVDWTCDGCGRHMPKLWSLDLSRVEIQFVIEALSNDFHRVINVDLDRAEKLADTLERYINLADHIDELEDGAHS